MAGEETFGGQLRRLRESAGLTQEELAERAGLSTKAVSLLERGERRRPYPHTVAALADALGLTAEQRAELSAAVRRGGPADQRAPGGRPVPLTGMVGRDRELRELQQLLERRDIRLVTLTGTGGVGKTRLALALLEDAAASYPQGTAFVPLAPVTSPDLVLSTVVSALGLTEAGREPGEVLRAHLTGRRVLLVLDNFEHLLAAAPEITALLETTPGPVVVATSRSPLGVRGEHEHAVAPLWTPETESPTAEAVLRSPAGRLFEERARAASPGFRVTSDNAADVASICRRLAGLPLALELAAARTRLLGPAQLVDRLDEALRTEGARDLPERHRTLARTLDWSHDLLGEDDRALFARLSVFAGGFTLEAAEAVVGGDVLARLGRLVDQSLVVTEPGEGFASARYRMLEPVRQYAEERLGEAGADTATRRAHAEWFAALAEEAYPHLERAEQIEWLDRLTEDNDNLRAALAWAVDEGPVELAVRIGWAVRMYWLMRDRRREGLLFMERALPRAGDLPDGARARLLHVLAHCRYGFDGPHRPLAEEGLALFRRADDPVGEEYALGMLGFALLTEGEPDEADAVLRDALARATARGDDANAAHLLNHLAVTPLRRGDREAAASLARQALACTERTGERLARQTALQVLAWAAWAAGDDDTGGAYFVDALGVATELDDVVNVAYAVRGLALCDGAQGRSAASAELLGAADRTLEEVGFPRFAWVVGELDDTAVAAVRRGSEDESWLSAYRTGRERGLDEVARDVLRRASR